MLINSSPAPRPAAKPILGQFVTLEPFHPQVHTEALWECVGGAQHQALWQFMAVGPFPHREGFEAEMRKSSGLTDPMFFAILDNDSNRAVGRAAFMNIVPPHRCLEVGHIMFSPRLQRTRHATEVMYLMMRHAFDDLGYRRYEWKCNAMNAKSRRAALRLGFTFEGIFRQHMIVKGLSRDTAWFSILDGEWPALKSAFEQWLLPANFDPQGVQRKGLEAFRVEVEKQSGG